MKMMLSVINMAWKVLTSSEKDRYVSITKDLAVTNADGKPKTLKNVTLDLAGMHIIQSIANHPEMMWGSYEHVDNNPLCKPSTGYKPFSFISGTCWKSLSNGHITDHSCKFNQAKNLTALQDQPSEICRVFADGNDQDTYFHYEDSKVKQYQT